MWYDKAMGIASVSESPRKVHLSKFIQEHEATLKRTRGNLCGKVRDGRRNSSRRSQHRQKLVATRLFVERRVRRRRDRGEVGVHLFLEQFAELGQGKLQ